MLEKAPEVEFCACTQCVSFPSATHSFKLQKFVGIEVQGT